MVVTMQYMFSDSVTQLEDQYIEISWNVGQYVVGCSVTNSYKPSGLTLLLWKSHFL